MTSSDTSRAATRRLNDAFAARAEPPIRQTMDAWAEQNVMIPERSGTSFPGAFRLSITPYGRGPMEAFLRRDIRGLVLPWAAQTGKTTLMQIVPLCYCIDQDPGPALFVMPNADMARSFSETRLRPVFDDTPTVARHKPSDVDQYKLMEMHFDSMTLNLIGANSPANLAARPIRYLFVDEPDKFPGSTAREADALSLAFERTKAFWNAKTILTCTPTTPEGNIWRYWEYSDKREYEVPCPHCGKYQALKMEENGEYRLHWPKNCAIRELDRKAWMECVKCNKKITDKDKPAILQRGHWRATCDATQWAGFHLSAFYPIWIRFGEIAASFLRSKRFQDEFRNFRNSWLGLPYDIGESGKPSVTVNLGTAKQKEVGYARNRVPGEVIYLTAGIDVQAHEIWYVVRGWGEEEKSWLIDWGKIPVETDDAPALLEAVKGVMGTQREAPTLLTGIDSGWGYRTADVYMLARRIMRLVCIKGRRSNVTKTADGRDLPIPRPTRIDRYPDGRPIEGGIMLYSPSTSFWKRWLYGRINADPTCWHWPSGLSDMPDGKIYLHHLESEREVEKRDAKTGKFATEWVVRRGYQDNHLLDCEIICAVVSQIIRVSYKMPELRQAIAGKQFGFVERDMRKPLPATMQIIRHEL